MVVRRTYRYRLCPTAKQVVAMIWTLDRCRELYNAALEERIAAYRMRGVSLGLYDQQHELIAVKGVRPEYAQLDGHMLRDPLVRIDLAFRAFFRRIKAGQKAGFPRFKGRDRYDSFTFFDTGWKLAGDRLTLRGIGSLKMRLHRPIQGAIKAVTIRRDADHWYACFSCEVEIPDPVSDAALPAVGIDVGLEHFATTSSGEHVPNPRHFRIGQEVLTRRSQSLARKKRGSNRRRKAKLLVAKAHRAIRNQRRDFHHKNAKTLVDTHSLIAVEKLQIANLVRRPKPVIDADATLEAREIVYAPNGAAAKAGLNKSIQDAGWGQFISILSSKAEGAGCTVILVNPAGTSQACSGCGVVTPKLLSVRWHTCEHCGLSLQRDVNAARNILTRAGLARQAKA